MKKLSTKYRNKLSKNKGKDRCRTYFYIQPLLNTNKTLDSQIDEWINEDYPTNPYYREQLTYNCPSGNMVRSKSETFIDIVLCQKNIPFRYEYELKIGNNTFYPDFTIMHPISKEIIYWEHLGKMDNPEYFRKALAKIKVYHDNGIFAGQNLILTFESKTHPFTYNEAEAALVQMNL